MEVKTDSPKETKKVAEKLAKTLAAGSAVALFGDLGAGKTVFAQGLAKGLGIKRKVISPTFVFMRSYPFLHHKKPLTFYHIDLYRGQDSSDFKNLGLEEVFSDEGITVLEWAEKIKEVLPKKRVDVFIKATGDKTRTISIKNAQ